MKKSELRQMIREVLKEELSNSKHFYITYQDSYGDSFTSYFVSDNNSISLNHWQKDLQHFDELYTDDNTCLVRAKIELSGEEANIFNAILNKEFNIRDKAAWVTADQLLNKLVKANMLQELDISYDY